MQAGERICGRYILEQRLGLGGMGEVWLAELEGAGAFRRRVVLKVLAPERRGDPRIAAMLADEARVVGALHHPGIVSALDYQETEEHGPIFVLEFVDGVSLRSVLRLARRQRFVFPEALVAHIGAQVAHALHAAHTAVGRDGRPLHVVHRDVAPDNILLARSGAVYLGDFGVCRAAGNLDVSERGDGPQGKPGFMAPEQVRGAKVGPAADIFSLGRVIAAAADVGCGPALRAVVERATAESPKRRYSSASEMAEALLRACPLPTDPDRALSEWLQQNAAEALDARKGGNKPVLKSEPPPPGRPTASDSRRLEPRQPLFAAVPPPRRALLKIGAVAGAIVFLALPLALILAGPQRTRELLHSAIAAGPAEARGEFRITSRPAEAEVYVDGRLRGVTPLIIEVPAGAHAVRVGSVRLARWRALDVQVKRGVEVHLDVNLAE